MKPEPESLNIKLPNSTSSLRLKHLIILAGALLSLYIVEPTSLILAATTLLIGTPIFALIFFGSDYFRPLTSRNKHLGGYVVALLTIYVFSKLLVWIMSWIEVILGAYGIS